MYFLRKHTRSGHGDMQRLLHQFSINPNFEKPDTNPANEYPDVKYSVPAVHGDSYITVHTYNTCSVKSVERL